MVESTPQIAQTISARPAECVFCSTPFGDTNMPDPIMLPEQNIAIFTVIIIRKIYASNTSALKIPGQEKAT